MNGAFSAHSDAVASTCVKEGATSMTTIIHFFQRLIHHNENWPIPDALLQDIGLSRVLVEFPYE